MIFLKVEASSDPPNDTSDNKALETTAKQVQEQRLGKFYFLTIIFRALTWIFERVFAVLNKPARGELSQPQLSTTRDESDNISFSETQEAIDKVTEVTTEEANKETAEKATELTAKGANKVSREDSAKEATEIATEEASVHVTGKTTEVATEESTKNATEGPTGKIIEEAMEEVAVVETKGLTKKVTVSKLATKKSNEKAADEAATVATEEVTEKLTEEATEESAEEATEETDTTAIEEMTERIPEEAAVKLTGKTTEVATEESTKKATEGPIGKIIEEAMEEVAIVEAKGLTEKVTESELATKKSKEKTAEEAATVSTEETDITAIEEITERMPEGASVKVTGKTTEVATEESTKKATEGPIGKIIEEALVETKELPEKVTESEPETEKSTEKTAKEAATVAIEKITEEATEESAEETTEEAATAVIEEITERVPEETAVKVTEKTTEVATEGSTKKATEGPTGKIIEEAMEEVAGVEKKGLTDKVTESEVATEKSTEKAAEEAATVATKGVTEKLTEEAAAAEACGLTEKVTQRKLQIATEESTEEVTEKPTEGETETLTEQKLEVATQATTFATRGATEKCTEEIPEKSTEEATEEGTQESLEKGATVVDSRYINVLILGETGTGKSTFINSITNYYVYDSFDEASENDLLAPIPATITLWDINSEECTFCVGIPDENETQGIGSSATENVKTYDFPTENGYILRLIDTPGMGDPRGVDKDDENCENILAHLEGYDELHAICFLVKSNNSRMTVLFEYCFRQILSRLEKSASKNIIFMFTNTRSDYYKGGSTYSCLKEIIKDIKKNQPEVNINFDKNLFYLDNEAFRILAALKFDIKIPNKMMTFAAESWDQSASECKRLISYIKGDASNPPLPPHILKDSISINEARRLIDNMSKPLVDMSDSIQDNILILKAHEDRLEFDNQNLDYMKHNLYLPVVNLRVEELPHPSTVCMGDNCVEYIQVEDKKLKHYRQRCHEPCQCDVKNVPGLKIGPSSLSKCVVMDEQGNCTICGCHFSSHMYVYERTTKFSDKIADNKMVESIQTKEEMVNATKALIKQVQDRRALLEQEQDDIIESTAMFSCFVESNAITPFNDSYKSYIEDRITREKARELKNEEIIVHLENVLERYELKKKAFYETAEPGSKTVHNDKITAESVINRTAKLNNLRLSGPTLRTLTDAASKCKEKHRKRCWPSQTIHYLKKKCKAIFKKLGFRK